MDKLEEIEDLEDQINDVRYFLLSVVLKRLPSIVLDMSQQIKGKMRKIEDQINRSLVKEKKCKSLDEWFRIHGRPSPNYGGEGFATQFKRNPRVYAGTKYMKGKHLDSFFCFVLVR